MIRYALIAFVVLLFAWSWSDVYAGVRHGDRVLFALGMCVTYCFFILQNNISGSTREREPIEKTVGTAIFK